MINDTLLYFKKLSMNTKVSTLLLSLFSIGAFAQISSESNNNNAENTISYLDSIKNSFVNHSMSSCIEERMTKELVNLDLFEEMESDISNIYRDEDVSFDELPTELLKSRLKLLDQKSPFKIEYNESLERVIKSFLKNRKKSYARLMGLADYYFPMFEEHLAKYDVPLEVKYLAIVESALNPAARSRVGATGLWQFMYPTGKQYGLEVNSFVDERSDPLKSSEAAAKYLSDLYAIFGDWDLVLASYNAGPGNVSKAIRRSSGYTNYWNIRKNLPKETQGYLPAFFATMYIFEYGKEHGIVANNSPAVLAQTDTIAVKKRMTFDQISSLLDISSHEIEFLNPTYKLKEIPYVSGKNHFVRLPINKVGLFASNEDKIYAYIDHENDKVEKPIFTLESNSALVTNDTKPTYHTVRNGESLGVVANKYGITVAQIKKWNNMNSNAIHPGKKLKVGAIVANIANTKPAKSEKTYTVRSGDSLYSISKKHPGISIGQLKKINNLKEGQNIHPGMKLRIDG